MIHHRFKTSLLLIALLVAFGSATAFSGGKHKLTYKMKPGEKLQYKAVTVSEQTQEQMGQEVTINSEGENVVDLEVEKVDKEGNITFVFSLSSMKAHVKSPMFDTTLVNPGEFIGKRTRQTITPQGKILKSERVDTLKLSGMLAQTGLGRGNILPLVMLPAQKVGIGDTWSSSDPDTNRVAGSETVVTPKIDYTLTAEVDTLGRKCVRISYKGELALNGKGKMMGMQFFIEGDGPVSGTAYFAPAEGRLIATQSSFDLDMTIALTGQMNMTIPSTTTTEMTLTLVE